jgi:hypothetical protein
MRLQHSKVHSTRKKQQWSMITLLHYCNYFDEKEKKAISDITRDVIFDVKNKYVAYPLENI